MPLIQAFQERAASEIACHHRLSAVAAGVPVVSTRIAGSLGILGETYPGYVEVGDAVGLASLLERCECEPGFLDELRTQVTALRPLVDPAHERASWRDLLRGLGYA